MELYEWQKKCLAAWEENAYRGIVNVVTGAGKTVFAMAAADHLKERFPDLMIKIVVPTIPLASQWSRSWMHHAPDEESRPGFFGGGQKDDPDRSVMIYIINSARNSLAKHIRSAFARKRHVLLICDECHHYQSRENRKIFDFLTGEVLQGSLYSCIGLSATPFSTANDHILKNSLGKMIYQYGFQEAVQKGTISPFVVSEVSVSFFADELDEYMDLSRKIQLLINKLLSVYPHLKNLDRKSFMKEVGRIAKKADMDPSEPAASFLLLTFQRKEISVLARARTRCCLAILDHLRPEDRILIFCERIDQAESVCRAILRKMGNSSSSVYHSGLNRETRKRIMEDFRTGKFRILVSCRCLDEGIDVPDANIGIVLSSSAVERQRIQRLGRIIRNTPGKTGACLYYLYIRESSDDTAYLSGLEESPSFSLRYYTSEGSFSNSLYEYTCGELLVRATEKWKLSDKSLRELRTCMTEGLVRPDYLLSPSTQKSMAENSATLHEKNYWKTMNWIGTMYR